MRTKTLLLTAALTAAGIATSMAQVFSVNAVGYVNTAIPTGFSMVSNPLKATDNTIGSLFLNMNPVVNNLRVFKLNPDGSFASARYSSATGAFTGDAVGLTLLPGEGVFVQNPGAATQITFVGEVSQGTGASTLSHAIPTGFSIQSSEVPQSGTVAADPLGPFAPANGVAPNNNDRIFVYNNATGQFSNSRYSATVAAWVGDALPTLGVGQAFYYQRQGTAGAWTRSFTVNQ